MFLMCGHPGSGKSTYARELARKNGFRYLSIDDMYATFNGDPTDHSNKFDVWMTFWRQIHAAEMAGHNIVVDTNAPTYLDRSEFLSWFSEFEHHLVWIDASEAQCLKNNLSRKRVIPEEQMKHLFAAFEAPDRNEYIRIGYLNGIYYCVNGFENKYSVPTNVVNTESGLYNLSTTELLQRLMLHHLKYTYSV
jgi:predicted kinase